MILYNSLLAKLFLRKEKRSFMIFGCRFTRRKYFDVWEEVESRIHSKQYAECFVLALLPAVAASIFLSWWLMAIPFCAYHVLYWLERMLKGHSIFDWEAVKHCGDAMYLRKRKSYAWVKRYCKKELPLSRWAN